MRKITPLLASLLLVSCSPGDQRPLTSDHPAQFTSNGERIYFTGSSDSGSPITSSIGSSMAGMHRQMHGGGCAVCHGADRRGKRLWPQFWVKAPALTAESLFAGSHTDDGHGEHGSYNGDSLRGAIIDGIDPAGDPLDASMPRWSMIEPDLDDLVAYLQQSHTHD